MNDFRTASNDSMFASNNAGNVAEAYTNYTDGMFPADIESRIKGDSLGTVIGPVISNGRYFLIKPSKRGIDNNQVEARHILIKDKATGKAKLDSLKNVITASSTIPKSDLRAKNHQLFKLDCVWVSTVMAFP